MLERSSNLKAKVAIVAATGLSLLAGSGARADQSKDKFHCPANGDVVALNNPNNHHLQEEVVFGDDGVWIVNASRGPVESFHYPAQTNQDENLLIGDGRREKSGLNGRFEVIPNRNWMRASWACYSGFQEATYHAVYEAGKAISPSGKNVPGWFQLECDNMLALAKKKLGNEILEIKDMNSLANRILSLFNSDIFVINNGGENWFAKIRRTLTDTQLRAIAEEFAGACVDAVPTATANTPTEQPTITATPTSHETATTTSTPTGYETSTVTPEASKTPGSATASPGASPSVTASPNAYPGPGVSATNTSTATPVPNGTLTVSPNREKNYLPMVQRIN